MRFVQALAAVLGDVRSWALAPLLLGSIACGARTELFDEEPSAAWAEAAEPSGALAGEVSGPTNVDGPPEPARPNILDPRLLPDCEPGLPERAGRECAFEVDGLCYSSGPTACACVVCERHLCVWEFPDENGTSRLNYCE